MEFRRNSLFILLLLQLTAGISQAATLVLQLRDPSGAAVSATQVTATPEGGKPVALQDTKDGNFKSPDLAPGSYQVTIRADGFKPVDRKIDLTADGLTLPIVLELAAVETAIEVDTDLSKLANSDPAYVSLRKGALVETWEVKDFKTFRENAEFLFNGKVSFGAPVLGKTVYAIFEGTGSFTLNPILKDETRYIEDRIAKCPLTEEFHAAIVYFTDGFADQIRKAGVKVEPSASAVNSLKDFRSRLHHRPQPAVSLAESLMHSNESSNTEAKLLAELYHGAPSHVSFRIYMRGNKYHDLRFIVDTRGALPDLPSPEEVALVNVDPSGTKDGIWYMAHLRGEYTRKTVSPEENKRPVQALNYKLETVIGRNAKLNSVAEVTLQARENGPRVLFFDLLPNLRTTRVSLGGQDLSFIQESRSVDGAFAVILPKPLTKDETIVVKIEYGGNKVLEDQGGGNFSVAARTSWYPNVNTFLDRATYQLTFRVPKQWTVVSVGDLKREWKEGDYACSEWESKTPLAIAGFNYGLFKKKSVNDATTKYQIETYATSEVPGYMARATEKLSLTPSSMAESALVDTENAIRLFTAWFGPIGYGKISITQQPQFNFGQSWPTLVYLPISAFLDPTQRYMLMEGRAFRFNDFVDEVTPHEVAHQWWGHAVGWASYRDQWLSEGFAEFSAAIFTEQMDKKGDRTKKFWERLRKRVVEKNSFGTSANDAGAITLGIRLDSEKHPSAYQNTAYPKGAFILHMLRQMMWDPRTGDDDFIAMMKDFVVTYNNKNASSAGFAQVVQKHMKPSMNAAGDGSINWFFEQFVFGTELPKYKLTSDVKPSDKGGFVATVQVEQSNVSENFVMPVPIYVEVDGHQIRAGSTRLKGNMTSKPIEIQFPKKPGRIMVNARHDVLSLDGPA